ncbi:MAG: N-acetyltransferase family protein, partial [Balneolaceae bacterium]
TKQLLFRPLTSNDWAAVSEIYKQGIETGTATFEQKVPPWEEWDLSHMKSCRLVAIEGNEIAGWAALSLVSGRCVYAGVAEISVYVSSTQRGRKIGSKLLGKLISGSESEGLWTLQAGIFSDNLSSIKIHEAMGFRRVGYRERIGQLNGEWKDTVLYERRSPVVGTT